MDKIRWGVIGAGGIADRRTIPGMMLADNAELAAVMEVDMAFAEKFGAKYGAKMAYASAEALLDDANVQAVYIASPVAFHRAQALAAAARGKHVLLEKPIGLSLAEARDVLDACDKADVTAGAGLMMRFSTVHRWMRDCVAAGRLGKIVSCRAQLTCWYPDIPGAWRQSLATSGGGALMDMGIHCIDLLTWITGSPVARVAAMAGTKAFSYDVDDSASVLFETQAGAYCTVESYFDIPDDAAKCRMEIYGTKGSLLAEGSISQVDGGTLEAILSGDATGYDAAQNRAAGGNASLVKLEFDNMYKREIEAFGEAVSRHEPAPVTLMEAYAAQAVVEAAYRSSKSGTVVCL